MFDFIRSKYEENRRDEERVAIVRPDAEEDRRVNYLSVIELLFSYAFFIFVTVYGAIHLKDCPAEKMLPISWIIIGSLGLLIRIITCYYDWQKVFGIQVAPRSKVLLFIIALLAIVHLGWFLAMFYWSFKIDPDTKPEDHDKPNYCALEFYRAVYWTSVLFLTLTGLGFLGICCVLCCVA